MNRCEQTFKAKLNGLYFMRCKFAESLKFGTLLCLFIGIFQTVTLRVMKCISDVYTVRYLEDFH